MHVALMNLILFIDVYKSIHLLNAINDFIIHNIADLQLIFQFSISAENILKNAGYEEGTCIYIPQHSMGCPNRHPTLRVVTLLSLDG